MTDTTKKMISSKILALVAGGMDVADATDRVLGTGTFRAIADKLHDVANARQRNPGADGIAAMGGGTPADRGSFAARVR